MRRTVASGLAGSCIVLPFALAFDWPPWLCLASGFSAGLIAERLAWWWLHR
jgi:hypothetical protein